MKSKPLIILAIAAGACIGIAYLVNRPRPVHATQAAATLYPDLAAKADSIAKLTIRKNQKDTVLEKRSGAWVAANKSGYPADAAKIRALLRTLAEASILEPKTSKPDLYSRLQVEDPETEEAQSSLLTVQDDTGAPLAGLIIGKKEFGEPGANETTKTYVRKSAEAQSYLVSGEFNVDADPLAWVSRDIGSLPNESVRAVTVLQAQDGKPLHIHRATKEEQDFVLDNKPEGRELKDKFVLTRLAWVMAFMTFEDVAPAKEVDTTVDGASIVEFRCFDGQLVRIRMIQKDGKTWASFRAEFEAPPAPEGQSPAAPSEELTRKLADLNAKWGPWVFELPSLKTEVLNSTMESLLKPLEPPKPAAPSDSTLIPDGQ